MRRHIGKAGAFVAALAIMIAGSMIPAGAIVGNNGTVKVDNIALPKVENANEPHVDCDFKIEWYGFDPSVTSHVTFTVQPPTGTTWRVLLADDVPLSDNATPGGSLAAFDGERQYRLTFAPEDYLHPIQGYHVKLTVNTPFSNGADVKHKVFWVGPCDVPPPPI